MNDGVALMSTAHPRARWYRRLWLALRCPRLSPGSLETIEIDVGKLDNGTLDYARRRQNTNILNSVMGTNMNDNEIEKEIQAKGLTAPRMTLTHVEGCIAYEYYITGDQLPAITTAVLGPARPQVATHIDVTPLSCLTLCVLVLKNGFKVTGESAPVSNENFDAALGRTVARQNALSKIWMLEGYLLKEKLHQEVENYGHGPARIEP